MAKEVLFDWASKIDGTPRVKTRKESATRRRLECEDILGLVEFLDKKKIELPTFVALKLNRVPKMSPSDVDTVNLAETVADLKRQVSVLATQLQQVTHLITSVNVAAPHVQERAAESAVNWSEGAQNAITDEVMNTATKSVTSFAEMMHATDQATSSQWFPVFKKKPQPARRIIGSNRCSETGIKTAGQRSWHIFVGRLDPSTTADDMTQFLQGSNINVIECTLLSKKETWQEKFAAFKIVLDVHDKDRVFDEVMWPYGADVRDWIFTSRK